MNNEILDDLGGEEKEKMPKWVAFLNNIPFKLFWILCSNIFFGALISTGIKMMITQTILFLFINFAFEGTVLFILVFVYSSTIKIENKISYQLDFLSYIFVATCFNLLVYGLSYFL